MYTSTRKHRFREGDKTVMKRMHLHKKCDQARFNGCVHLGLVDSQIGFGCLDSFWQGRLSMQRARLQLVNCDHGARNVRFLA